MDLWHFTKASFQTLLDWDHGMWLCCVRFNTSLRKNINIIWSYLRAPNRGISRWTYRKLMKSSLPARCKHGEAHGDGMWGAGDGWRWWWPSRCFSTPFWIGLGSLENSVELENVHELSHRYLGPTLLYVLATGDQNLLLVRGAPDQGDSVGSKPTNVGLWLLPLNVTLLFTRSEPRSTNILPLDR
jgi:hypothetical protein